MINNKRFWFFFGTGLLMSLPSSFYGGCQKVRLDDALDQLKEKKVEAQDKRRERDTCMKLYSESTTKVKEHEYSLAKSADELATCRKECINYNEIFNSFTAGVISTNVVSYFMDDKELRTYCDTNWQTNLAKNYPGAKLVSFHTSELTRSRSGALFLVVCDWTVPSRLWCDRSKK